MTKSQSDLLGIMFARMETKKSYEDLIKAVRTLLFWNTTRGYFF